MGCAVDFPAVATLVVAGAAIGAARSIKIKGGWHEKPGIYAVIVSPPGTAKTPALRAVMNPIYEEQDRLYQGHRTAVSDYQQAMEEYKQAKGGKDELVLDRPTEPPPLRHIFANDTTVEALAGNLENNRKGLLVFRDELTAWVRSMDMYRTKGTDRQFFLSAWSGEMVKVDRKALKGQPIIIPHPFIAVLGGIQPDLLDELEAKDRREDGFIHRLLFSYPPTAPVQGWIADEITEADKAEWRRVVGRLLNLQLSKPGETSERPKELLLSAEAQAAFAAWCDHLAKEMNHEDFSPDMVGPCSKLRSYCPRFALVIHLLRVACEEAGSDTDEGLIDVDDVNRAIKLCDYFRAHYRLVACRLQQTEEDRRVDALLKWMQKKNLTSCTLRDVCRANVCGIKKKSEALALLEIAVDREYGDWKEQDPPKGPTRGRNAKNGSFTFVIRQAVKGTNPPAG
jgi:hypothetical protein